MKWMTIIVMFTAATLGFIGLLAGIIALEAWVVMLLWNWVAAGAFGAPVLSFWLSVGLVLLVDLLSGGLQVLRVR